MIEAIPERPGWLRVHDAHGRRHVISVFAMKKPRSVTAETTLVPMNQYKDLFVRATADEVRAAAKRARTLRKSQQATAHRVQLAFDFNEEAAVQLPTETAAANTPPKKGARSGESRPPLAFPSKARADRIPELSGGLLGDNPNENAKGTTSED